MSLIRLSRFSPGLTLCLLVFTSSLYANPEQSVSISDAWVKEAPPGVKILAAYLCIKNRLDTQIALEKVESPDFDKIEIHRTVIENSVARMEHQTKLLIEAKKKVELEPGGLHLMLFTPARPIKQSDEVTLTFYFSNNSKISIKAPVKRVTGLEVDHSHHHH